MLYNEDEASTAGILNENGEENWKITQELSYDKVLFYLRFIFTLLGDRLNLCLRIYHFWFM